MAANRFDAHCHIFEPRFRLKTSQEPLPAPFTVKDYRAVVEPMGFVGGTVVASPLQGYQQGYLLDALRYLGPNYVGVTQLPLTVTHAELDTLNGFGIRGLRLSLRRGGTVHPEQVLAMARRIHQHAGWHVELTVDPRDLADLEESLLQLPALCLDYRALSRHGLPSLLRLAEHGVCVKVCSPARLNLSIASVLKDIQAANPNALMFGTGLPLLPAQEEFAQRDIEVLTSILGDWGAQRALWNNAMSFYRMQTS